MALRRPADPSARARDRYGTQVETVRSRDGTTIAFDRSGRGPSLIIVNGALSDRGAVSDLAPRLADQLTVIAYDRRGRGDSTDTPPYAVEREVEDLAALVDVAGGSAFVLGHSSGAVLALSAAAAGVPIERLALYEPPLMVDDARPPIPDDYVSHLDELVAAGRRSEAVSYFLTTGPLVPPQVIDGMRQSPGWPPMEAMAHTIPYDARIMDGLMTEDPGPLAKWASVATPTLVLDGGASPPWIRHGASALVEILPNASAATLEGQGHGPASNVLAPVLLVFFAEAG
jgi:pimeloyl-ACP methyl ester carboxylesterase